MSIQKTVETKFGTLHFFEKSVRVDGIAETLYLGQDPLPFATEIESFLRKIYQTGRSDKADGIRNVIYAD